MNKEYSIDYGKPDEAARTTIQIFLDQLMAYRGVSRDPDGLEWEIRVYEYMLQDPVKRLAEYQKARMPGDGPRAPISKRKAVASLGWNIPEKNPSQTGSKE